MAWKAGSAAALRAQKEKGRHQNQETTAASTPAKATQTSTAAGGWAKGSAAALREQKQTEATNIDLTSKAFDEYRANNNLGFADEMDSRRDWLNQQDMGTKDIYKDVNRWKDTDDNRNLSEAVKRIDGTHGAYTDADLIKNSNWTQAESTGPARSISNTRRCRWPTGPGGGWATVPKALRPALPVQGLWRRVLCRKRWAPRSRTTTAPAP